MLVTIIALAFAMNTLARGITETFAVFLLPVEAAFGASRSQMTATYSIYMLVHGIAAPFAGQLIDRLGARVTYGAGLILLGGAYLIGGHAQNLWHYYLSVGVMSGLGAACLGMVVATGLLSRWVTNRVGSIMSIPYAAVGFGVLVFPPLTQLLIGQYDWRTAHVIIGCGIMSAFLVVMLFPLARITRGSEAWRAQRSETLGAGGRVWGVASAVRTRAFWALFAVYFWTSVSAYAVLPQSVAFLVESGFDPLVAAGAFGLTGGLSTLGILAMGQISDRFGRLYATVGSYICSMVGIALLVAIVWVPHLAFVYGFVVFFGLMQGARGPVIAGLVATLYRGGSVGAIFGALSLALGLGAAFGSWASGLLHDLTSGYVASFGLAIAASAMGLLSYVASASLRTETMTERP